LDALPPAAESRWPDLAAADPALAEVPGTHPWYPEAVELRASWRTRVTNDDRRRRFGDEAVAMIDRVVIMQPTLGLFGLRTRAGFSADRPEVVIESVASYAKVVAGLGSTGGASAETLRHDAKALRSILDDAAKLAGADPVRIEEVRREIARTLEPK
jgi:hypothetical protein